MCGETVAFIQIHIIPEIGVSKTSEFYSLKGQNDSLIKFSVISQIMYELFLHLTPLQVTQNNGW